MLINNSPIPASVINPLLSTSQLSAEFLINLNPNSNLSLELFGIVAAAVLQTGAGASLTVVRLS